MMKINFKRNKNGDCSFLFQNLTHGKALALCRAINDYSEKSTLGMELNEALKLTVQLSNNYDYRQGDQDLMDILVNKNG